MTNLSNLEEKEKFWDKHIEQANLYPGGKSEYCKLNGFKQHQLYHQERRRGLHKACKKRPSRAFSELQLNIPKSPESSKLNPLPDPKWLANFLYHWSNLK